MPPHSESVPLVCEPGKHVTVSHKKGLTATIIQGAHQIVLPRGTMLRIVEVTKNKSLLAKIVSCPKKKICKVGIHANMRLQFEYQFISHLS